MNKLAYSYLRFSTPEQAGGDSRRRQLDLARTYAAQHGLVLDAGLSFRDLGMSAFHGRNAREGALRAFLDAVELGLVPRGSHLLVESLDRLSRDRVLLAQSLFLRIVEAGITIVTLIDERSYSAESLNRSPMDLIVSLVCMMRANEESVTKSARLRAAWTRKRAELGTKPAMGRCPGWLRLDKTAGRFVEREREADVIRRIYAEAAAGLGQYAIARKLNAEAVPMFNSGNQRGKAWGPKYIRTLLTAPAVRGTYIPCITGRDAHGRLLLQPQAPVEGYYPAVVDPATCEAVAHAQEARRRAFPGARASADLSATPGRLGRVAPVANLLAGLGRCPLCGCTMQLQRGETGRTDWRYLTCSRGYIGAGCERRHIRYSGIEAVLSKGIDQLVRYCPTQILDPAVKKQRLKQVRSRLAELRFRRMALEADAPLLLALKARSLSVIAEVEAEEQALVAERRRMRPGTAGWLDVTLRARLEQLRALALSEPLDPPLVNAALKSLLTQVVVDWPRSVLVLTWRHGGRSEIGVEMTRRRALSRKHQEPLSLGPLGGALGQPPTIPRLTSAAGRSPMES